MIEFDRNSVGLLVFVKSLILAKIYLIIGSHLIFKLYHLVICSPYSLSINNNITGCDVFKIKHKKQPYFNKCLNKNPEVQIGNHKNINIFVIPYLNFCIFIQAYVKIRLFFMFQSKDITSSYVVVYE